MRVLAALVIAAVLSSPAAAQQPTLQQEVEALLDSMVVALKANPESVARFYTDDGRIVGGGQRAEGRDQIDAYWRSATMFSDWTLEVLDVGGDRFTPWVHGRSTLRSRSGGMMVTEFVGLLRRQPEGLRFHVDIFAGASPGARPRPSQQN